MRHVKSLSRLPKCAQSGLCATVESQSQAQLCFLLELLTSFFLPLFNIKYGPAPESTAT